jgi:hypothetical protein
LPLNNEKSKPIFVPVVVSHFKSGFSNLDKETPINRASLPESHAGYALYAAKALLLIVALPVCP